MRTLTGEARLAGVIGWPVAHSRSPRLHGFWLERMGIDGAYVPLPVRPGDFEPAVRGLLAAGFRGGNVTLPHKQAAFAICDARDDAARRAGAVNTLVFEGGKILGRNTDGPGFVANLRAHGIDPAAGPAQVLGAGGAARAVAAALLDAGAAVSITNRTPERAEALARALPALRAGTGVRVLPWAQREAALADHALVVNTTSAGMAGHDALPLDLAKAPERLAVADIVYVPLQTKLLAAAAARGLRCAGGLGMLLHQAGLGFEAWFGVRPEVDAELEAHVAADIPKQ
ncbi:MAG TPA: shikimate dehydrogenase [Acetobacteraceae bacterium]|jgi:shikimate dehydrogenase|nr:shikimate dehydrogenase [Acetobacteraceae bacterium]